MKCLDFRRYKAFNHISSLIPRIRSMQNIYSLKEEFESVDIILNSQLVDKIER